MLRMMNTPQGFTWPVNIGNNQEFTMLELAESILAITGSTLKIIFKPLPKDDPRQRQPDTTMAKTNLVGWEAKVPLKEGLTRTINYFEAFFSTKGTLEPTISQ